jgi:hypothetical protein
LSSSTICSARERKLLPRVSLGWGTVDTSDQASQEVHDGAIVLAGSLQLLDAGSYALELLSSGHQLIARDIAQGGCNLSTALRADIQALALRAGAYSQLTPSVNEQLPPRGAPAESADRREKFYVC